MEWAPAKLPHPISPAVWLPWHPRFQWPETTRRSHHLHEWMVLMFLCRSLNLTWQKLESLWADVPHISCWPPKKQWQWQAMCPKDHARVRSRLNLGPYSNRKWSTHLNSSAFLSTSGYLENLPWISRMPIASFTFLSRYLRTGSNITRATWVSLFHWSQCDCCPTLGHLQEIFKPHGISNNLNKRICFTMALWNWNDFCLIISCHLRMLRVACWFQRFGRSGILSPLGLFSCLHIVDAGLFGY